MSSSNLRGATLLAAGLALAACTSTRVTETWKAPDAGPLHFQKVLALALVEDQSVRRIAEARLQASLRSVQAVQSHEVLDAEDLRDRERAKERLRQAGFDGVVALRLVSSRQEQNAARVVPHETFWGVYMATPVAASVETLVQVEISVYSLAEDKLLWTGVSEFFDPAKLEQLITEIVEAAAQKMREQGLLS